MDADAFEEHSIYSNPDAFTDPETRELAEVLRRLEGVLHRGPCVDWAKERQRSIEILEEISSESDKTERLISLLDGVDYEEGGDEHILFRVDDQPDRIFKATYGDNFGCYSAFDPIDPELSGKNFNATGNADICFYLRRWILLNSLGGYKTRFEGILPPEREGWLPRICISQPWLEGTNPTSTRIAFLLKNAGFLEVSRDAFYLPDIKLLLTDTAPRNVRVFDNSAIPFDAIAEIASHEVVDWIKSKNRM